MNNEGFPGGLAVNKLPANAGDAGSIPGSERSPGEVNDNPFQYSCLGNPIEREAWLATVHGVTRVGHDLETKTTIDMNQKKPTTRIISTP